MQVPRFPLNEEVRLSDLLSYDILDTPAEKDFDELAELAAYIYGCPTALISFLDKDRQWFKARKGFSVTQTDRNIAFCAHTILENEVMVVEDALKDDRFSDNPLVTGEQQVRFYAGAPIVSSAGNKLGTVCVLDRKPRELSAGQTRALTIISHQVSRMLELRVRNKVIGQRAGQLLEIEKKTVQKTLLVQEKERQFIGTELHENVAQSLAALNSYLDMALGMPDLRQPLLEKSKEVVQRLVKETRHLSHAITPTTLKEAGFCWLMNEFILQYSGCEPFRIHLECHGNADDIKGEAAVNLYRIVEEQFEIIRKKEGVRHVFLGISASEEIVLSIRDDGKEDPDRIPENEVRLNTIRNRTELYGGSVSVQDDGRTVVVILPPPVPA
ncbi:GAF domain-containing protein [Paraflavisolibacter sp. H34]|uniref:GAF domain-containing sensor histidine kinase n=1 Tax=Huijunlia imazamoxiresistens TaxID=3127457 RepID=UPI003019B798